MFNQYKLIIVAILVSAFVGTTSFYYVKSEKQELTIGNQEVEKEIAKDQAETEVLETKWETIAAEHNKTIHKEKDEIKEPVTNEFNNSVDFEFFGMFSPD